MSFAGHTYGFYSKDLLDTIFSNVKDLNKKTVLEIGCGWGFKSYGMSTLFKKYIAIDISRDSINIAKGSKSNVFNKITFMHGRAEEIPIKGHVDIVIMVNVFHFTDYEKAMTEILRVLKPGGKCFIKEPHMKPYGWAADVLNKDSKKFSVERWDHKKKILETEHKFLTNLDKIETADVAYNGHNRIYIISKKKKSLLCTKR